jgi:methionyl-tRNA formyltransferase
MDSKLNVVFFGTPSFVVPVLENLHKNFNLVGVVTAPDTEQGRKKILTPSPVKSYAEKNNIEVFQPDKLDTLLLEKLRKVKADIFVVAAYGKIIPQSIIESPRFGSVNIHPSLLPLYRGPSPIQTALLNGDSTTGISIIKMDEKMDHGPILSQWKVDLQADDTFEKLHFSLFEEAAKKLPSIITDYVENRIVPTPQIDAHTTTCHMITRVSGYFDSNNPPNPQELDRMIRAYYPWPNAWTKLKLANGKEQIVKFYPGDKVQVEGGKPMNLEEFFNGHPELREKVSELLGGN